MVGVGQIVTASHGVKVTGYHSTDECAWRTDIDIEQIIAFIEQPRATRLPEFHTFVKVVWRDTWEKIDLGYILYRFVGE